MKRLPLIDCCAPLSGPTLSDREAKELEQLFRALGDRHRVKIVNMLALAGEEAVCVCELVPPLGLSQPTVSYHLKQLTHAGLLERERRGTFAYYRLAPGALDRVSGVLAPPAAKREGPPAPPAPRARRGGRPSSLAART
jgi:ArsR family transcriptional regulator, arsenate/arsenite/antimonite-responsive transcriptional repressor